MDARQRGRKGFPYGPAGRQQQGRQGTVHRQPGTVPGCEERNPHGPAGRQRHGLEGRVQRKGDAVPGCDERTRVRSDTIVRFRRASAFDLVLHPALPILLYSSYHTMYILFPVFAIFQFLLFLPWFARVCSSVCLLVGFSGGKVSLLLSFFSPT